MTSAWPAVPSPTRRQVEALVRCLCERLPDDLAAIYLHGSLALGGFNPARSDLDLLVVTHAALTAPQKTTLLGDLLTASGSPHPIEISFVARPSLRVWRYPPEFELHFGESWRARFAPGLAAGHPRVWAALPRTDPDLAAHFTVTAARGATLWGAPAREVLPAVPRGDYLASVAADLEAAFARIHAAPVYAILNACRTLAYLREGVILSKLEGGRWARRHTAPRWRGLITAALTAHRADTREDGFSAEPQTLEAFVAAMCEAMPDLGLGAQQA